jgi:hypothetical protein
MIGVSTVRTFWDVAAVSSALLFLSGCSVAPFTTPVKTSSVSGAAIQGRVFGGQNPISGAKVYLYAVGSGGYGGSSTSLLSSPGFVTTDSNGNFSISGEYNCGTNQQVYVYAKGGNPGLPAGTNNTAAGLLAGLGQCSTLLSESSSFPFIYVNEVSTIATAYALAGYATDATDISSSGSALAATGVANTMAAIPNLETLSTGVALLTTPAGNGAVPQAEINTLANILAACINTSGSVASGQPCYKLFTNALLGGTTGTQPTDTATAAINIAHNPGANIAALYALQTGSATFQPMLSVVPNDFTIALSFTGGGLSEPYQIAIDGSGNVWETDIASVSEFNALGSPISGSSGFTGGGLQSPSGIAIDGSGNAWVADASTTRISEFNSSGLPVSGSSGFTGGGLDNPTAIAISGSGDVWVANLGGNSVSEFNSSGSPLSGSGYAGGGLNTPEAIAVDGSGDVWIANEGNNSISELGSGGSPISGSSGFTGGGLNGPWAIAIDGSGDAWVANVDDNSISAFGSGGSPISGTSGFTGGGLDGPASIAVDGSGRIWTASGNNNATCPYNTISEFAASGTAISDANGYCYPVAGYYLEYLAVDGSGNVWVTTPGSILEFVGVATPVVTPIVANLQSPYGQHAVNKP